MTGKYFQGFQEIKADNYLIEKTKSRMSEKFHTKRRFSVRKIAYAAASFVIVGAVVTYMLCGFPFGGEHYTLSAKAMDFMQGVGARKVDVSGAVTSRFIKSTQNFSVGLFKQSYQKGKNTLISPTSAMLALGMAANGAGGKTREEFTNVLGKYGLTVDDLNRANKAYSDELTQKRGSTTFSDANSIWFCVDLNVKKAFLQNNADYYGASARKLNFYDKNSVNIINSWVKSNTNGKIEKIVDKIEPNDAMFLINALYFNAKWEKAFDESFEDDFNLDSGAMAKAKYMSVDGKFGCMSGKKESAVLLPYDDSRFSMLCILPDKGISLSSYISSMTEDTIPNLMQHKTDKYLSVTLPRYTIKTDKILNDSLQKMGLAAAFKEGSADFSKISRERLHISKVRQSTFLRVDQSGTEAAAATSVEMMKCTSALSRIYFNRPFVCAVVDNKTDLPLFLCAVENPAES